MPRRAREISKTDIYHLMIRGINKGADKKLVDERL